MILSGQAKLAGVMGWPVKHSRSPRLHGFWLQQHEIDGAYLPLLVAPENFETALRALADLGFRGVNVTVPHKEAALAACDEVDALAARTGAVNTILFKDGRILGSNSDGFGFMENLHAGAPDWRAASSPAVVLGAGGGARAVVAALIEAGVPELRLLNRTAARAESLAAHFGAPVQVSAWSDRNTALEGAGLLVNTTTLGMSGQADLEIDLAALPAPAVVTDLVYVPLETPLLAAAKTRALTAVDGLGMLLHQARPGFDAWFGVKPEVTEELRRFVQSAP